MGNQESTPAPKLVKKKVNPAKNVEQVPRKAQQQQQHYQQQQQPQQYYQQQQQQQPQQYYRQQQQQTTQQPQYFYQYQPPPAPPVYYQEPTLPQLNKNVNSSLVDRNLLGDVYNRQNTVPVMPYPESTVLTEYDKNYKFEADPYNFNDQVDKFKKNVQDARVKFEDDEMKRRKQFEKDETNKFEYLNNVIKDFEEKYNPYEILELKNNDNNKEHIKRAYKKLALKYHPDKAGEKYTQRFQLITQSYIYLLKKADQENEIKNKTSVKVENKDYEDDVNEQVHNIHLNKDKFDINTFNTIFEKYKVPDVYDDGYNDLLNEKMEQTKEDSNFAFGTNFNKEIFNSHFDKQKKKKSSTEMIEYNEPDALDAASSYGFSELGVSKVNDFGVKNSNNLSYTDYKKAHIDDNLLIDTNKVKYKEYKSVEQLENDRSRISFTQSNDDKLRYDIFERKKREDEDKRLNYLKERDELLTNQFKKINQRLIVHK
jgi:curved DNA-binding protein CbpA